MSSVLVDFHYPSEQGAAEEAKKQEFLAKRILQYRALVNLALAEFGGTQQIRANALRRAMKLLPRQAAAIGQSAALRESV